MLHNKRIVYIIPSNSKGSAISENIHRRKRVLEKIGYTVETVEHQTEHFLHTCFSLWKRRHTFSVIMIRLDGTGQLDKYTLLKFVLPSHVFLWELHGFPKEREEFSDDVETQWLACKDTVKRWLLSYLPSACIFISEALFVYAKGKMHIRRTVVIPNFVTDETTSISTDLALSRLLAPEAFLVLWGGDASLPWQATDLIPEIARRIYRIDKTVTFFVVGSHHYYPIRPQANIVYLEKMPYEQFLSLTRRANVCLCLYHKPQHIPFYFYPMKLLTYLMAGKPVIATDIGSMRTIIQHGVTGFLHHNAVNDIVRTIRRLKQNRRLAAKISNNARRLAITQLNDTQAASIYETLLHAVISQ